MTCEFFTINAFNVAHAAIREAERSLPIVSPVEHEGRLVVRTTNHEDGVHDVPIDEAAISACHRGEDIDLERLVSDLACDNREGVVLGR